MVKPAVLLLNLGSPDSTSVPDVRRYLKEFLLDERVIDAPAPVRNFVVRGMILPFRPKRSSAAYAKVWTPEGSPLIVSSQQQRQAVDAGNPEVMVELAMRYGTPSIPEAIARLKAAGVTHLFIVPLYPHYAMSSYETVLVRVTEEIAAQGFAVKTETLQPFYRDDDYISALVESARPYLEEPYDLLLFSYHGIPERHLRKSDPSHAHCLCVPDCCATPNPAHATCYRHQCLETTRAFVEKAGIPEGKFAFSFQSRLGRDPWLKPYTDHMLEELPGRGVKRLRVICPAFVSDCLETLEEIAMEGKETFLEAGGEDFKQIPCLNNHPAWLRVLNDRVGLWLDSLGA
ncbi:ferrochelatase [Ruficoccus amylovorans]|uniref:Ferrochelatase n=1 Tax=Ruficoccus amylovorans TaxID=1804625 RepID=A0A842HF98_9BACT|nr:ferrochelatase [Ruficoccus amylovorans]MBC2593981.1 ferrochelatase [Ruficoccus amylovorans]